MRALVLSGGGAKGAYQVGALRKLLSDDSIEYDLFAGVSVGAINAAFLAQYMRGSPRASYLDLEKMWLKVTPEKIYKKWKLGWLEVPFRQSVYDSSPLRRWIAEGLDTSRIGSSGRQLRVIAVSVGTGEERVVNESGLELASWVAASAAFPVMLTPVSLGGELWTDGGLRSITPLGEAIRAGATEIDMVLCSHPDIDVVPVKGMSTIGMIARSLDIMSAQIQIDDLRACELKNKVPGHRKITVRTLSPNIGLGSSLDFEQSNVMRMMKLGYEDAKKRF